MFFSALEEKKLITNGEIQITEGLNALIKEDNLNTINFKWCDTEIGLIQESAKFYSKDNFDFSKIDEYIYFKNKRVIKFFSDSRVADRVMNAPK